MNSHKLKINVSVSANAIRAELLLFLNVTCGNEYTSLDTLGNSNKIDDFVYILSSHCDLNLLGWLFGFICTEDNTRQV